MTCPVDWSTEFPDGAWLGSFPYLDWYYCLSLNAVDGDDLPYQPYEFEEFSDPPEELERVIINLEARRPAAVELYMKRAGRLKGLKFLSPGDHGKHFVGNIDPQELKRRTRNAPSLFLRNYGGDRLENVFWFWFQLYFGISTDDVDLSLPILYQDFIEQNYPPRYTSRFASDDYVIEARLWRSFLSAPHLRIALDTLRPVGASGGEMTTHLCYDIHLDSKIVHCYPISKADAKVMMDRVDIMPDDSLHDAVV